MENGKKDWMVRTRGGDILGPFSQRELLVELRGRTFSIDDEIGSSSGQWISAQALESHDPEEFTRTSTRNHTITKSLNSQPEIHVAGAHYPDELTPTPDVFTSAAVFAAASAEAKREAQKPPFAHIPARRPPSLVPTLVAIVALAAIWGMVNLWKAKPDNGSSSVSAPLKGTSPGDSPFVRQIYKLILAGETQAALRQLTRYHEQGPAKGDVEYLVPYSALLITEGESPQRARKYLEQIMSAPVSVQLKSRAHHWLGYLMLSLDEGDMGEAHFLDALRLNPKDAAARFNLGRAYLKQEKFSQALDSLQLVEIEMPELWLVHIYKGRARAALGNMDEARVSFKTAVEASPDRWLAYVYYALFLLQNQEVESAQNVLKQMLTRDPHYEIHSPPPLGFYQEKVNYTEYLNAFTHVMEKTNGEEREMGRVYINYLMTGKDDGGRIEAVADKGGGILSKVLALKVVLDREGDPDDIRRALSRLPQSLQLFGYYAYVLRGEAKMRLAQFQEAKYDFTRAIELSPQSAVSHWVYASLLSKTQHPNEAQGEIRGLLARHPNYIPAVVLSHTY